MKLRLDRQKKTKVEESLKKKGGKKLSKKEFEERKHRKWVLLVTIATFFSTILITYISDSLLASASLFFSLFILIVIIAFGILADIIGVAITAVTVEPFNAMAAKKIPGAKTAVTLIRNAPRMSNILNDVIGDICGIVSGATGVAIVAQLALFFPLIPLVVISLVLSGLIAAFTVGGKAVGKDLAMKHSVEIVFQFSKVIHAFQTVFGGRE